MKYVLRVWLFVPAMLLCAVAAGSVGEESEDNAHPLVNLAQYADVETRVGQDSELTLVVAISGGGYRAANFALGALLAMEQIAYKKPNGSLDSLWRPNHRQGSNLLNEVDYFSTVSGGGLAAAVSVMSRLRASRMEGVEEIELACSGYRRQLLADWISEPGVLESLRENHMIRLITSKFSPSVMLTRKTSGDALQMRLDQSILRRKEEGGECGPKKAGAPYVLGDVLPRARDDDGAFKPNAPYLFMNSTNIATGEIVPLTPGWLERENVTEYWHGRSQKLCAEDEHCGPFGVPLALALRSSMNFPAGIPPTRINLGNGEFLYLTDGGESDNLGAVTAVDILNQERKDHPGNRRMLIVIDAFRGLGRKNYNKEKMPGLVNSVMRATSLPLDAHRLRVKQDFYFASARQLTVLDAISDAGDVSVAYVDMEQEPQALAIGTSLGLKRKQQIELICAGMRQALVALGMIEAWDQVSKTKFGPRSADLVRCSKANLGDNPDEWGGRSVPKQGIVAFNRQSKTKLIGHLATGFTETMRRVRNPAHQLTTDLEDRIETESRSHRRDRILKNAERARKSLEAPKVKLTEEDLSDFDQALDQYAREVAIVRAKIESQSSEKAADEGPVVDEEKWYVKWSKQIRRFFKLDEEDAGKAARPNGGRTGDSGMADPNAGIDEKKLKELKGALEAMWNGAREIKDELGSTAESGELGSLTGTVRDLNDPHNTLLTLVVEMESGETKQLREFFSNLLGLMGLPQRELGVFTAGAAALTRREQAVKIFHEYQ